MSKLMIVESPHKSKTIAAFLGKGYKVVSSKGHIMDLATSGKFGLGVDVENDFKPTYVPISGKKKLINELKKDVKAADFVYLATDPDREGEAISWHLKEALGENIDPINNKSDNVESGSWEVYDCYIQAKEKHPEDVIWWTYAYYNRGKYFENQDAWKNSNNPNYKEMHKQANARSSKFKEHYNFYYNELIEMLGN